MESTENSDDLADIRTQLGSVLTRKLETFQVKLELNWARANQCAGFIASLAIFFWAAYYQAILDPAFAFFGGVLAGTFAPFSKDLVSRLSQVQLRDRYLGR